MGRRKTFERGQSVEIQRDVGSAWEPATYRERWEDIRGWHSVDLPKDARPRYILNNGEEVSPEVMADSTDERSGLAMATRHAPVPSQRIRAKKVKRG